MENNGIKEYIVDFYPIKFLQLNFVEVYKMVEIKYEELEAKRKEEEYQKMTTSERRKINNKKNRKDFYFKL